MVDAMSFIRREEYCELQKELRAAEDKIRSYKRDKEQLLSANSQLEEYIKNVEVAVRSADADYKHQKDRWELDKMELTSKIADLERELHKAVRERADAKPQLERTSREKEDIEKELSRVRTELGELRAVNGTLPDEVRRLEQNLASSTTALERSQTELGDKCEKVQQLQGEMVTVKRALAAAESKVRTLEGQLESELKIAEERRKGEVEQMYLQQNGRINMVAEEKQMLEQNLRAEVKSQQGQREIAEQAAREAARKSELLEQEVKELKVLRDERDEQIAELQQSQHDFQAKDDQARQTLEEFRKRVESLQSQLAGERQSVTKGQEEYMRALNEASVGSKSLQAQLQSLKAQLTEANQSREKLGADLDEWRDQAQSLQHELHSAKEEGRRAAAEAKAAQRKAAEAQTRQEAELKEVREESRRAVADAEAARCREAEVQAQQEGGQAELSRLQQELEEAKRKLEQALEELEQTQKSLLEENERSQSLADDLKAARRAAAELELSFDKEKETWRQQNLGLEEQVRVLEARCDKAEEQNERLEARLEARLAGVLTPAGSPAATTVTTNRPSPKGSPDGQQGATQAPRDGSATGQAQETATGGTQNGQATRTRRGGGARGVFAFMEDTCEVPALRLSQTQPQDGALPPADSGTTLDLLPMESRVAAAAAQAPAAAQRLSAPPAAPSAPSALTGAITSPGLLRNIFNVSPTISNLIGTVTTFRGSGAAQAASDAARRRRPGEDNGAARDGAGESGAAGRADNGHWDTSHKQEADSKSAHADPATSARNGHATNSDAGAEEPSLNLQGAAMYAEAATPHLGPPQHKQEPPAATAETPAKPAKKRARPAAAPAAVGPPAASAPAVKVARRGTAAGPVSNTSIPTARTDSGRKFGRVGIAPVSRKADAALPAAERVRRNRIGTAAGKEGGAAKDGTRRRALHADGRSQPGEAGPGAGSRVGSRAASRERGKAAEEKDAGKAPVDTDAGKGTEAGAEEDAGEEEAPATPAAAGRGDGTPQMRRTPQLQMLVNEAVQYTGKTLEELDQAHSGMSLRGTRAGSKRGGASVSTRSKVGQVEEGEEVQGRLKASSGGSRRPRSKQGTGSLPLKGVPEEQP